MAAPDTGPTPEEARERDRLVAIWAGLVVAALLLAGWLVYGGNADVTEPGRTGPVTEQREGAADG